MNKQELFETVKELKPVSLSLYFPEGDAEAWWKQAAASAHLAQEIAEIRAEGQKLDRQAVPELTSGLFAMFAWTGSRLPYEKVYFERRRRLNTYVFLALLEPENPRHLEQLEDIIRAVCGEYTWCLPAHLPREHQAEDIDRYIDLFSSETGFTLSEISLLLGERLPAALRLRIQQEVELRLFRPFLTQGPYEWETARHNWAAVCAGSIGAAALLSMHDPGLLTEILFRTESSMRYYLEGFGEDGACLEGLGYWNYGFGYFTYYSDLLRSRSGGKLDRFHNEKVRKAARFQQQCFIDGALVANFSDSLPQMSVHMGLSHYLAEVYPGEVERPPSVLRAPYTEDHCSRFAPALRNLLWTRPGSGKSAWNASSCYLPDAAWLISRYVSEAGTFGFAAKGGHNAEPHNHNDLGQFILTGRGEVFTADLGSGEYTADYFGAGRYQYDCNGSQGHSVPVIDGRNQSQGQQFSSVVLHASTGDTDELSLDVTRAYEVEALLSLTRSFVWHKEKLPRLELLDEYRYEGVPGSWTERFVTWRKPLLLRSGVVLLPGAGGGVEVSYDPVAVEPEIAAHRYRDHFGREQVWHSLDFHAVRPGSGGRFAFTFQFL
ncbi:heparinase II/III family protein [Paenibacillus tianjinensis]|uniref:Heparinase II/III family protein n=1 Tax=Paenibacillus tianjinensis TaxID=2810347 RepID=A0ABX7L8S3_9BACL|nr:heparinase II/III family protein [Paenibacillus tianjinensis]QSF43766.1 heparinase II/III family protein [Paenibacillus tianjinensis]